MPLGEPSVTVALVLAIVFLGGLVKGVAGFGYAVAGTALLATVLEPSRAVVVMILPTLAANLSLVGELDREGLRTCARRFGPYLLAALTGTLLGMGLLGVVPRPVLALGLGLLTLGYVLTKQEYVDPAGQSALVRYCVRPGTAMKAAMGLVSGIVFGATNIAVQVVAYLDNLDLDRPTFVGVLAMILVGISTVRVAAAWVMGLYASGSVLSLSVVATVPGVVGVSVGSRLRTSVPEAYRAAGTLVLLTVIGLRLVTAGLSGLA